MGIISLDFLVFYVIVLGVFYIVPSRFRTTLLLIASYAFYFTYSKEGFMILLGITALSFVMTRIMDKLTDSKRTAILVVLLVGVLAILSRCKYMSFFTNGRIDNLILPIGLSFYSLMAIGYIIDVYRKDYPAEKNIISYALFLSFFPIVTMGPIERGKNLLPQFKRKMMRGIYFDAQRIRDGFVRILWGLFMKIVVADRLAIMVQAIYDTGSDFGGAMTLVAIIGYSLQIYFDFAGYSHIAIGLAQTFGIDIMENFQRPYLAQNIRDFWHRWHISLSTWFSKYIYISLGGNRKGIIRKYVNIMIVFLVSGLWHGAGITFMIWGALHGLYHVIGALLTPVRDAIKSLLHITEGIGTRIVRIVINFVLVSFAWILFRADDITHFGIICKRFEEPKIWQLFNGSIYNVGWDKANLILVLLGIVLIFIVDLLNERDIYLSKYIANERLWIRWPVYILAIMLVVICGIWGSGFSESSFIYSRF